MNSIFTLVYEVLVRLSEVTGFSYEEINIIVYYMVVPTVFVLLLDRIVRRPLFTPCFVLGWVVLLFMMPSFSDFSENLFDRSVAFLNSFGVLGMGYVASSVLICVILPGIFLAVLVYYAFPQWSRRVLRGLRCVGHRCPDKPNKSE